MELEFGDGFVKSKDFPGTARLRVDVQGRREGGGEHVQAHVVSKWLPFNVYVVAGPSGSYREHDILDVIEKWLLPWGPGREWEFCLYWTLMLQV